MNTDQRRVGRVFWLGWFFASVMGYGAGILLGVTTAYGLFRDDLYALQGITIGLAAGTMAGLLQWIVLRKQMARSGLWVPATAVTFAAAFGLAIAGSGADPLMVGLLLAGLFGLGGGVLQWLVLRRARLARAELWIPANLLALLTCPIAVPLANTLGASGNYPLGVMVLGLLIGASIGVVDGALLLWLLRQSPSRGVEGLAAAH